MAMSTETTTQDFRVALERFLSSTDLRLLEQRALGFNIFEAIGAVRAEVRHSSLLAYFMDPYQNHGCGTGFLAAFLDEIDESIRRSPGPVAFESEALIKNDVRIERERFNIDILVHSHEGRSVLFIENKIGSKEHSNQLERYKGIVDSTFPGFDRLGVYLSPEATPPSSSSYIAVGYDRVTAAIQRFLEGPDGPSDQDVRLVLSHYVAMLERHVVTNSEVAQICRRIYREHRGVLDLIFQHRPNFSLSLIDRLKEEPSVIYKAAPARGRHVQFTVPQWDLELLATSSWPPVGRMLLFQFNNDISEVGGLTLNLYVGPGELHTRRKLISWASTQEAPFNVRGVGDSHTSLFVREFLSSDEVAEFDVIELEDIFNERWSEFVHDTLPVLVARMNVTRILD